MLLEVDAVRSGYHGLTILHDLTLSVEKGEIVAIVGANGAGKSTTLKMIVGEVRRYAGEVRYDGNDTPVGKSYLLARLGLMLLPENRGLFGSLTVEENLLMGRWARRNRDGLNEGQIFEIFPILKERRSQVAQTMSGGQQQMLAIGRALMGAPKLLMLDEPSTGLSPKLTWDVFDAVRRIRESGVSVLIVEQNARQVLELADRAYVLESGSVALEGEASVLANDARVQEAYLGG